MKSFNTKIIAILNQKGGVGKTTSSINIASFLAITETPTLLIDMDPQANASSGLGIDINNHKSIYDIIINNVNIKKCILQTKIDYLDIIPSHTKLSGAEIELVSIENERFKDNIVMGGLMLCKAPVELVAQRNAYYRQHAHQQIESVDNNLMRENDPRMPLFSEKQSQVTFGKGKG